jgi:PQQ-dependent catabolism-associated CXXCW motif protein
MKLHRWSLAVALTAIAVYAGTLQLLATEAQRSAASGPAAEPSDYKNDNYRSAVPATLKGARVVTAEAARALLDAKAVFIDVFPRAPKPDNLPKNTVWRDVPHDSIEGAVWLPNVGYGVLAPTVQDYFTTRLAQLTAGDKNKTVVFFCLKNCWMSWNAAKRALAMGYTDVVWFPDGTDGWLELPATLVKVQPMP